MGQAPDTRVDKANTDSKDRVNIPAVGTTWAGAERKIGYSLWIRRLWVREVKRPGDLGRGEVVGIRPPLYGIRQGP